MNMVCMTCGIRRSGSAIPCGYCGSVLPALSLKGEVATYQDNKGASSSIGDSEAQSDAPMPTRQVASAQAIQADVAAGVPEGLGLPSDILQAESAVSSQSSPAPLRPNGIPATIGKQSVIAIGMLATVVLGVVGNFLFSTNSPVPPIPGNSGANVAAPSAADNAKVQALPAALESRWFGKWVTADGKKRIEITAQSIAIATDEWKRSPDDKTLRYKLSWTATKELGDAQFGYAGKSTSPADIGSRYKLALEEFKKGSPDFAVSPTDDNLAQRWIAMLAPKSYQVLHGSPEGDSLPTEWILDDAGNMLEVNAGHYGFHLRLLQREGNQAPVQPVNSVPPAPAGAAVAAPEPHPQGPIAAPQGISKTEEQIRKEVEDEMAKNRGKGPTGVANQAPAPSAPKPQPKPKPKPEPKAETNPSAPSIKPTPPPPAQPTPQPVPPAATDIRHPQDACADRGNFVSREICLARECQRPEKYSLPFCVDRRKASQNNNPASGGFTP